MIIDLTNKHSSIQEDIVGGKAYNLQKLAKIGLPVPSAIVILGSYIDSPELKKRVLADKLIRTSQYFAVRSSGIGEDDLDHSFAGIFDTYLNVEAGQLMDRVKQVHDSLRGERSDSYRQERHAKITGMNIIVQEMVQSDISGVAFSSNPSEETNHSMVLEIVRGKGDSLVSGSKTPATLRINKLTGLIRIHQSGEDAFGEEELIKVAQTICPLIELIEDEYGYPVDVEWTISKNKPSILQARPITSK